MAGTFTQRIGLLRENLGTGQLIGGVEVNQRYAADQHFHDEYSHPDGGKAYFLRDPLYAKQEDYMQHLAENLLKEDGTGLSQAMMDNMESLSDSVYAEAPMEFADLKASGHPSVSRDGVILHDRAPYCSRISDEDLREKAHTSRLFDPKRYLA